MSEDTDVAAPSLTAPSPSSEEKRRAALHQYQKNKFREPDAAVPGLDLERRFEVHSLRPAGQ